MAKKYHCTNCGRQLHFKRVTDPKDPHDGWMVCPIHGYRFPIDPSQYFD